MCRLRPIRCFLFPSQDLAAIPDFQSGAMENWGLTTYRESSLLFDAEKSLASSKLGITMTVSHELAHQVYAGGVGSPFAQHPAAGSLVQTVPEVVVCSSRDVDPAHVRGEFGGRRVKPFRAGVDSPLESVVSRT